MSKIVFFPADVEYQIYILANELKRAQEQIPTFEIGVKEERDSLMIKEKLLESLFEALNFLKGTESKIISLKEIRLIQIDIAECKVSLKQKRLTIENLQKAIRERNQDVARMKETIDKLVKENRKGVILNFRKKNENER